MNKNLTNEGNLAAKNQPGNIINCFGKQVEKNKALKEYSEIIQSTDIAYEVNMLNKNITYELEKKQKKKKYYHLGMISLKFILVLCISVIDVTHIFKTLPAILKEMNDNTLSSFSETKELASTINEDLETFSEDIESINEIKETEGDVNKLFSYTFINLLKKLADFDLSFETYRMNIIFIEQTLSKSNENHDIINKFLYLSKKQMFEAFKKSLQCLGIKNDITYTQFEPIFEHDNQLDKFIRFCDILDTTLSKQENINKSFFSRFYSSKKNKNNYYIEILFSIFSNSDEIFDKLGYIFTLLNSYISKMNILLTIENDNCTKFPDIIPESEEENDNYPCYTFFSLIINKLLKNYNKTENISTIDKSGVKFKESIEKPKFLEEEEIRNFVDATLFTKNCLFPISDKKFDSLEKNMDLCKYIIQKNDNDDEPYKKIEIDEEQIMYQNLPIKQKQMIYSEILPNYFDKELCDIYLKTQNNNQDLKNLNCDNNKHKVLKLFQETADQIGGKRKSSKSSKKRRIKTSKKKGRKTNKKNKKKKTNKV